MNNLNREKQAQMIAALVEGRPSLEVLHDDEGLTLVFTRVVNRADVRVIQSRGGAGFALKSPQS